MALLNSKTAIVTGAASGIGAISARTFADHEASVVVASVDEAGGRETVASIEDDGGEATFVEMDVSTPVDADRMIETAVTAYGGLDVLFNNAAVEGPVASTVNHEEAEFEHVLAVNLKSVWLGMKYGIEAMLDDGGGSIISTSSIGSMVAIPEYAAYGAAKAGVNQLTRTVAIEYIDRNIRANAIAPGVVQTEMVDRVIEADADRTAGIRESMPPGLSDPTDIANAAVFLGSELSKQITGTTLPVDGGYLSEGKHDLSI